MSNDDDGKSIRARRLRLMAVAVAGLSASTEACSPQCNPFVCLSMSNPGAGPVTKAPDAGSLPTTTSLDEDAGPRKTLVGIARDGKAGPAIIVDGSPVYVKGKGEWPPSWVGKRVRVTGRVVTHPGLPADPPPKEAGIVGPYRVLENAVYELAE